MSYRIELGWMNLTPCSRIVCTPTSIPGVCLPSAPEFAEQRLYAYAIIDCDNLPDSIHQALVDCALAAAGTAGGVGAITANPGAALAAFKGAFLACFTSKFADVAINDVHLDTASQCMW